MAILKTLAEDDKILHEHLYTPKAKNATYLSPKSQNEVINIMGYDIILSEIVNRVKSAKLLSVLADEVTSHNKEHLAICLRYVNSDSKICEDFVSFVKMDLV